MKKALTLILLTFLTGHINELKAQFMAKNDSSAYKFYLEKESAFLKDSIYNEPYKTIKSKTLNLFNQDMDLARQTFKERRFEICFQTLKVAERKGLVNKEFYMLLGLSVHYLGEKAAAKRYLMRGYNKYDCLECKEAVKLLR